MASLHILIRYPHDNIDSGVISCVLSIGIIKVQIRFLPLEFVSLGVNRPLSCHNYATLYYRRVIHTLVINRRDALNISMEKTVDTDEKAALFYSQNPIEKC